MIPEVCAVVFMSSVVSSSFRTRALLDSKYLGSNISETVVLNLSDLEISRRKLAVPTAQQLQVIRDTCIVLIQNVVEEFGRNSIFLDYQLQKPTRNQLLIFESLIKAVELADINNVDAIDTFSSQDPLLSVLSNRLEARLVRADLDNVHMQLMAQGTYSQRLYNGVYQRNVTLSEKLISKFGLLFRNSLTKVESKKLRKLDPNLLALQIISACFNQAVLSEDHKQMNHILFVNSFDRLKEYDCRSFSDRANKIEHLEMFCRNYVVAIATLCKAYYDLSSQESSSKNS